MDPHSRSASPRDAPRPQHRPPSPPPAFDNRGYQHDEDPNHNDSFTSTNGHTKSFDQPNGTPAPEAVNLELINLTPKNGKKKKDEIDQNATNPYDEYFVPVNEHRKYMRGEKLYVTADKRGEKGGCKRPLCWTLLVLVAAAVIALIALAATGVLFTNAPTTLEQYNSSVSSARALGGLGLNSQPEHDHSHDHFDQDMSKQTDSRELTSEHHNTNPIAEPEPTTMLPYDDENMKVQNVDSDETGVYVPRTVEGQLKVDNEEYSTALEDPESEEFHQFSHVFSSELKKVVFDKDPQAKNYNIEVSIVKIRPGSLIVTYRIHWKPLSSAETTEELMTPAKLNKTIENYLENNSRMIGLYHVAEDQMTSRSVLDLCQVNKNDCEYECEFDETALDFVCSCPRGKILDMTNLKKCVLYLESTETTSTPTNTKQKESRELNSDHNDTSSEYLFISPNSSNSFDWQSTQDTSSETTTQNNELFYSHIFGQPDAHSGNETAEPVSEPTAEPAAKPAAEPAPEPATEPTAEPTAEPAAEPSAEPAAEPSAEPAAEPSAEPAAEPSAEPAAEPSAEPAAEPTAEPAAEPQSELKQTSEPEQEATGEPETQAPIMSEEIDLESISQPEPTAEPKPANESLPQPQTEPLAEPAPEPEPTTEPSTEPKSVKIYKTYNMPVSETEHDSEPKGGHEREPTREEKVELVPTKTEDTTITSVTWNFKTLDEINQHQNMPNSGESDTEYKSSEAMRTNVESSIIEHLNRDNNISSEDVPKETATRAFSFSDNTKTSEEKKPEVFSIYERQKTGHVNADATNSISFGQHSMGIESENKTTTVDPIIALLNNVNDNNPFDSSEKTTDLPLTTTTTPIPTMKSVESDEEISFDLFTRQEPASAKSMDKPTTTSIKKPATTPSVLIIQSNIDHKIIDKTTTTSNIPDMHPTNSPQMDIDNFIKSLSSAMDEPLAINKSDMDAEQVSIEATTTEAHTPREVNPHNQNFSKIPVPNVVDYLENKTETAVSNTTTEKPQEDNGDISFDSINMFYNRSSKSITKDGLNVPNSSLPTTTEDGITTTISDWAEEDVEEVNYNKLMGFEDTTTETPHKHEIIKEFSKDDIEPDYLNLNPTQSSEPDMPIYGMVNDYDLDDSRVKRVNTELKNNSGIVAKNKIEINLTGKSETSNSSEMNLQTTTQTSTIMDIQEKITTTEKIEPVSTLITVKPNLVNTVQPETTTSSVSNFETTSNKPEMAITSTKLDSTYLNFSSMENSEESTETNKINITKIEESTNGVNESIKLDKSIETTTVSQYIYKASEIQGLAKNETNTSSENQEPAPVWEVEPVNVQHFINKNKETLNQPEISNTNITTETALSEENNQGPLYTNNLNITIYEVSGNDSFTTSKSTHSAEYEDHETEMNPFLPEVENNKSLVKKLQEGHDLEPASGNETQNENIEEHPMKLSTPTSTSKNISSDTTDSNRSQGETNSSQSEKLDNFSATQNLTINHDAMEGQNGSQVIESQRNDTAKSNYKSTDKLNAGTFLADTDDLDNKPLRSTELPEKESKNLSKTRLGDTEDEEYLSVVPISEEQELEKNSFLKNRKGEKELNDISDSPKKSDRRTLHANKIDSVINNEA